MLDSFVDQSNVEGLDSMKIRRYLESRIAPDIFREKTDVAIDMDEEGKITFEGTGLFGRKLDIEAATRLFEHALLNDITYVNLPLIKEEPVVTILNDKLKEMGIIEQVSGGETDFSNSPGNRIVNINVGLSKFEGHLVKPGEEFCFLGVHLARLMEVPATERSWLLRVQRRFLNMGVVYARFPLLLTGLFWLPVILLLIAGITLMRLVTINHLD